MSYDGKGKEEEGKNVQIDQVFYKDQNGSISI